MIKLDFLRRYPSYHLRHACWLEFSSFGVWNVSNSGKEAEMDSIEIRPLEASCRNRVGRVLKEVFGIWGMSRRLAFEGMSRREVFDPFWGWRRLKVKPKTSSLERSIGCLRRLRISAIIKAKFTLVLICAHF